MAKRKSQINIAEGLFSGGDKTPQEEKLTNTIVKHEQTVQNPTPNTNKEDPTNAKTAKRKPGRPTAPDIDEHTVLLRQGYYITEEQKQNIEIFAAINKMNASEVIRMLIDKHLKLPNSLN